MDLVFVHGWGTSPFVWKGMVDAFQEHQCYMVNLGFLGEEDLSVPNGKFIGIGHSLGGAWLLKHYPERLSGFVSVASFNCFYKHIPTKFLNSMRRNIAKDPAKQLQDFWHHAGFNPLNGVDALKQFKPRSHSQMVIAMIAFRLIYRLSFNY